MTIKTYAQKSSAVRAAKKAHGEDYQDHCTIKANAEGQFYIETEAVKTYEPAATSPMAPKTPEVPAVPKLPEALINHEVDHSASNALIGQFMADQQAAADAQANAAAVNESEGADPLKPKLSSCELPTKKVWHIADEMMEAAKDKGLPMPKRKEVIAECVARGVAYGTARTQYQHWFKTLNDSASAPIARIGADGKVTMS